MISNATIQFFSKFSSLNGVGAPFLQGNSGDQITAIIDFECTTNHNYLVFEYGLPDNSLSENQYTFAFPQYPSLKNKFVGARDSFLNTIGQQGAINGTLKYDYLGLSKFRITHTFILNKVIQNSDLGNIPSDFLTTRSPKYVFRLGLKVNLYDPTEIYTVRSSDLNCEKNGSVGYFNEIFNGFPNRWELFTFQTLFLPTKTLNFTLKMKDGFNETLPLYIVLTALKVNPNYDINKTFADNFKYAQIETPVAGGTVSNSKFTSFKTYFYGGTSGTVAGTFNFDPSAFEPTDDVIIFLSIGKLSTNETDNYRENVFLTYAKGSELNTSDPNCLFKAIALPPSNLEGLLFSKQDNPNLFYTNLDGAIQDTYTCRAKFQKDASFDLKKITINIKLGSEILETRTFVDSVNESRNYKLASGVFNQISFNFDSLELIYAFKLRFETFFQNWALLSNVYFEVVANGIFNFNEVNFIIRSANFQINDFDETQNNPMLPQMNTPIFEFWNSAETVNFGQTLNANGLTLIVVKFNSIGLIGALLNELAGVVSVYDGNSGTVFNLQQITTFADKTADSPFVGISNVLRAEFRNYTSNSVELVCLLNGSLINLACPKISARIFKLSQSPVIGTYNDPCCKTVVKTEIIDLCPPIGPCQTVVGTEIIDLCN